MLGTENKFSLKGKKRMNWPRAGKDAEVAHRSKEELQLQ